MKTSSDNPNPDLVTPARLLGDGDGGRARPRRHRLGVGDATIFLLGLAAVLAGGLCMFLILSSL